MPTPSSVRVAALERERSPIVDYTLTVQHPKRGRLLSIGDHEANWLCMVNSGNFEECNVESLCDAKGGKNFKTLLKFLPPLASQSVQF